jgi:hypothetical protein
MITVKKVQTFSLEMGYVSMRKQIILEGKHLKWFKRQESRSMILENIEFIEEFVKHQSSGLETESRLDNL